MMKLKTVFLMSIVALCTVACSDDNEPAETPANLVVSGTYKGYTDADCAMFQDKYTDNVPQELTNLACYAFSRKS